MLKNDIHHSIKLQRSYNKAKDKTIFLFEIIEEVPEDKLKEREQYYIDLYDSFIVGYNCIEKVDNPSSSTKISKKKKNKILLNNFHKEFLTLYIINQEKFIFNKLLLERLNTKHYQYSVYKNVINMMNWFMDNYGDDYIGKIDVCGNKQYYIIIIDDKGYEFVCYKWYKNIMYVSEYDTKIYRNSLMSDNLLDLQKHYVLDIPIYK